MGQMLDTGDIVHVTLRDGTFVTVAIKRKMSWLERWPGFLLACLVVLFWEAAWLSDIFQHKSMWVSSIFFLYCCAGFANDLRGFRVRLWRSA